jgi:anti-sigma B factor antagonist
LGSNANPVAGVSDDGEAVVVRLQGEIDLYNAPALKDGLAEAIARGPRRLVVDLAEVTFLDSTALGAFVEAKSKLGHADGFALAAPGLEARRALEVSGLDRHLAVHETVEAALKD